MALTWTDLASWLGKTEEEVQTAAAIELIKNEMSKLNAAEVELIHRYGADDAADLESRIRSKALPEHPAWEDLIEWEAIEDQRKRLKEYIRRIGTTR